MKKRILIFVSVVFAIVVMGTAAMLLYAQGLKARSGVKNSGVRIEFASDAAQTQEEAQTQAQDDGQAADETNSRSVELYEEALAQGQKAMLVECADGEAVTLAFAGDVLLDSSYAVMANFTARGSSVEDTFYGGLLEQLRGADVFMLNNEFPFSERGTPTEGKQYTFRADPESVSLYGELGVDLVSLANNHAYDYGEEALLDTFDTLEGADIPYVGAGRNIEEAKKPVYLIANGMKIAVVSATQIERLENPDTKEATADSAGVFRCLDPAALLEVIAEAKENSDFVILYIHWGTESQEEIDWLQEQQAQIYAQAGVDLIIGAHSHCLQEIDAVEGVPVVYSLGNFWFHSRTQDTCVFEVTLRDGGIESMQLLPCRQEDCRTGLLDGEEAQDVLEYMRGISPNVTIDGNGYVFY